MNNKLLTFFISNLLLVTVYAAASQNGPSTLDDDLDFESEESDDQPFNMGEELFNEDGSLENTEDGKGHDISYQPSQHPLLAAAHFTLRYELAYSIEDTNKPVVNRTSVRLQWEKNKGNLFVRFDGKADTDFVYNNSEFSREVKDRYRDHSEIREFYLQLSKGPFSAKLGRQLVVWGKADGGIVTDIMSPRDLTELVFTSIEDARIGQDMFVADLYYQSQKTQVQHQWSLIITPDIKVNDIALPGHPYGIDFSPTSEFSLSQSSAVEQVPIHIVDERPGFTWTKPEVGIRWSATVGKMDWSMMAADVYDNNPIFTSETDAQRQEILRKQYLRYQMLGLGFNRSQGSFVWKGELAFKNNREFNLVDSSNTQQYKVFDSAFGFDFNANGVYSLSIELSNQHIVNWDNRVLKTRRDESVVYVVWNKPWFNETLTTQYTASAQLQDHESFHRFETQYDFNGQLSAEIQVDYFDSRLSNSLFGQLRDKHRVSLQVDYDF